jgi:TonB family protein
MRLSSKLKTCAILLSVLLTIPNAYGQYNGSGDYQAMEMIYDENMDYTKQIQRIVKDYPSFSYSYNLENGEVKSVTVSGVEDEMDKKRLEVVLYDLKSNENMIKNKSNRIGVFYSVDQKPKYTNGNSALQDDILNNLKYPEEAENWGVEGTLYVRFVVDEEGNIPFANVSEDIETPIETYVKDLEEQAVEAVKATSGQWEPGKVNDVEVPTMVVLPVTFDFQQYPTIRYLVH